MTRLAQGHPVIYGKPRLLVGIVGVQMVRIQIASVRSTGTAVVAVPKINGLPPHLRREPIPVGWVLVVCVLVASPTPERRFLLV